MVSRPQESEFLDGSVLSGGGLVLGPGFGHFQDLAGIPDSSFGRIRDSGQSQDSGFLGTDPDSGFWTVQIFLPPKVPKSPSNASKRAGLQILDACLFDPRFEIPDPRFGRIRDSGYPDTFQDGPGILAPPGFRIRYYPIPPVGQIHPLFQGMEALFSKMFGGDFGVFLRLSQRDPI